MQNEFFQMLKKDHEEVTGILGKLAETIENASKKPEELFQKLRTAELAPHMKAEEIAFYQPLIGKKDARKDAMEGMEEHHVTETVLKELEKMPRVRIGGARR